MAPRWPQVNNGPEHINEHATYLREACNQLQAADKGRTNQIPWNIVQPYIASTIVLISKVLQQPSLNEILQQIQDTAKGIQNIQRDITVVKGSVGVSTTPLNAANFSGIRTAAASWAQVAAQAKGSTLPPPPPPLPTQQGAHASMTQATVTAYKDRVVTVKLKDHGIVQRYRAQSAAQIRQQVQVSVRDNTATKQVKIIAAHQLKSGDIQIFASTIAEAAQLKENKGWLPGLGEHAELIVPTSGVIVHGISTSSINVKDQKATIQQILADNYTVIPKAEISYVGWLTREGTLKQASSIVVEFNDPEMANAIIYAGMVWDGQIHQCQLYDRACRVTQCFRCHHYGHICTQCNAPQKCGYCAEQHETKHCKQKGVEGFIPRCTVCKGAHTAWSNACSARKKEMGRVEQAKQLRSIYWHVPAKENSTRTKPHNENRTTISDNHQPENPAVPRRTTQGSGMTTHAVAREVVTSTRSERPTAPLNNQVVDARAAEMPVSLAPTHAQESGERLTAGTAVMPTPVAVSVEENWATPAAQQGSGQQQIHLHVDLQPSTEGVSSPARGSESSQIQLYPIDGMDGTFDMQDAGEWLNNMIDVDDEWLPHVAEDVTSIPTSKLTDSSAAQSGMYKGCTCPEHQELYINWPAKDAELVIAQCMRICPYCGSEFRAATDLRRHLDRVKYARNNLRVFREEPGKVNSTMPSWTSRLQIVDPNPGSLAHQNRPSTDRTTRSQSLTNRTNEGLNLW